MEKLPDNLEMFELIQQPETSQNLLVFDINIGILNHLHTHMIILEPEVKVII